MTSDPKRETVLPHQLHGFLAEGDGIHVEQPRLQTKSPEGNPAYHLGVPTGPSKFEKRSDHPKLSSPSRYHKSYLIDQAGSGVIALKDTEKLPICLIKCCQPQKRSSLKLQFASHKNLVSLIDHFHSDNEVQLIYEYEHLAISLGCVAGTVSFSEADIATICKEVLDGLKYVHTVLRITYGLLDFSNILITWQGEVKLANIGESLLLGHPLRVVSKDLKGVGSIVVLLSDRTAPLREANPDLPPLSSLATEFVQRTDRETSVEHLIEDEFLHLANPGGTWSLKRHYFDTLPLGIRIGNRVGT